MAGNFDNTPEGQGNINPDIFGAARGNANNLVGSIEGRIIDETVATAAESIGAGSDIINPNPQLGALQDNGGSTLSHALLHDSPARNAGNNDNVLRETFIDLNGDGNPIILNFDNNPNTTNAQLPYDQRLGSFSRIVGGIVDIGAFEVQEVDNSDNITFSPNNARSTEGNSETQNINFAASLNNDISGLELKQDSLFAGTPNYSPSEHDGLMVWNTGKTWHIQATGDVNGSRFTGRIIADSSMEELELFKLENDDLVEFTDNSHQIIEFDFRVGEQWIDGMSFSVADETSLFLELEEYKDISIKAGANLEEIEASLI